MTRVRVGVSGAIGRITLARPDRSNAVDRQMLEELYAGISECDSTAAVRAVLLTAEGEDFCVGADPDSLARLIDAGNEAQRDDAEALGRIFLAIRGIVKPIVAAVRGRALGVGAGLAGACDIVLAHQDAQLGYSDVRGGSVPAIAMATLRRAVGEKRAADLVLSGRTVNAEEAERIGLVSRVLPAASFEDEVEGVLAGLAGTPRTAAALTKWLFYKLDELDFADAIAAGVVTAVEVHGTDDFRAGVRRTLGDRGGDR